MKMLKTVVVDDEPLARARLHDLLEDEEDIEIVAECGAGTEAIEQIRRLAPDLLFLDVQMPGSDGFDVIASLDAAAMPSIIFVTAFDRHAVKAFEVHAVDYLLKPFDHDRFREALQRARDQIDQKARGELASRVLDLANSLRTVNRNRLIVKSGGRLLFWRVDQIDWIEAEGNYVRFHIGTQSYLLRETMASLESRLDPQKFMRIHRSRIVNVDRIRELEPTEGGDYEIRLDSGVRLTLSRTYRSKLQDRFGTL